MDGADRDLGWEDVGASSSAAGKPDVEGKIGGSMDAANLGLPVDSVSSVMINHFANEFRQSGASYFPAIMNTVHRYFNVTDGYVARKMLWQLVPVPPPKKKDGELSGEKDWATRIHEGLEVNIEEPDLYIPTMGLATYVLLCGLIQGLQERFQPQVLYSTSMFAVLVLGLEVIAVKVALTMGGAVHAPIIDLAAVLAYKFFYLSIQLVLGLILGYGSKPEGFLYPFFSLGLVAGCAVALYQTIRRLTRMHPTGGALQQECVTDVHRMLIKGLPALEVAVYYIMLPAWPPRIPRVASVVASAAAGAAQAATTAAAVASTTLLAGNSTAASDAAAGSF